MQKVDHLERTTGTLPARLPVLEAMVTNESIIAQNHNRRISDLEHFKQSQTYQSAFTVRDPIDGPTPHTIMFITTITNIGGHYNESTGQFICQYPGIYVFSLHLSKDYLESWARCYIQKNGVDQAAAYADPGDIGSPGQDMGSNTVALHLEGGDAVALGNCSKASSMDFAYRTTFSGFLLKADNDGQT